jgi:two-component sensor histidine kinase
MNMKLAVKPAHLPRSCIDQMCVPMAAVEGAAHILTYANAAFCRLADRDEEDLLGRPFQEMLGERAECLALLNHVHRSGKPACYTDEEHADPLPVFWSYTVWPISADEPTLGVMIQKVETTSLYEKTLAWNEALVIGSMRQHELTAVATLSNIRLQTEVEVRKQREHDARMLTNEIAHRIKNNLQIVSSLIDLEADALTGLSARGCEAMQARIEAIAELYDLMSQSDHGKAVAVDEYLREIANAMSASLLGTSPDIKIRVEAQALEIEPDRAVAFGLLVNELTTNAIKHAFPRGAGTVVLTLRQTGVQLELDVADNGVGMKNADLTKAAERHGADYVAIFVRQLGGTLNRMQAPGTGTIVRIRFPARADT